jgi:hypothetical protein
LNTEGTSQSGLSILTVALKLGPEKLVETIRDHNRMMNIPTIGPKEFCPAAQINIASAVQAEEVRQGK